MKGIEDSWKAGLSGGSVAIYADERNEPDWSLATSLWSLSMIDAKPIADMGIKRIRDGVRSNRISFPSQVPVFEKHDRPDLQRGCVQLYFTFCWSCSRIARRYGLSCQRVQQILNTWKRRAVQTGYVQAIPPLKRV